MKTSLSTTCLSNDPFLPFRLELESNILSAIKLLKSDGVTSMGLENLQMVVKPPRKAQGPMGSNVRWWYAQTFREVATANSNIRKFLA